MSCRTILLISDDPILTLGLHSLLGREGLVVTSADVDAVMDSARDHHWRPDLVLLRSVGADSHHDRHRVLSALPRILGETARPPVACIGTGDEDDVLRLRMAEAGAFALVSQHELAVEWESLVAQSASRWRDSRFLLPPAEQIRRHLGFTASGALADFLRAAEEVAPGLAAGLCPAAEGDAPGHCEGKPVPSRTQIRKLRAVAAQTGGLPRPDASRYSTAIRQAPALPEWPLVRSTLLSCWGRAPSQRRVSQGQAFPMSAAPQR
ncbi:response regulator [Brevibacterium album]|uniref:response regulator n=1 Tax=Brevibacterium album TaxID=417948 RepID=UPI0004257A79|nr:response regulator [Brevibacterium album]